MDIRLGDFVSCAGKDAKRPLFIGEAMLNQLNPQVVTVSRSQILATLTRLRQEWQEATTGKSLLETDGNMGLILADVINGFGLTVEDQCQVLGHDLFLEIQDFLYAPNRN